MCFIITRHLIYNNLFGLDIFNKHGKHIQRQSVQFKQLGLSIKPCIVPTVAHPGEVDKHVIATCSLDTGKGKLFRPSVCVWWSHSPCSSPFPSLISTLFSRLFFYYLFCLPVRATVRSYRMTSNRLSQSAHEADQSACIDACLSSRTEVL